jgi:hypothetical protein
MSQSGVPFVAAWPRPRFEPTDAQAQVFLIAFSSGDRREDVGVLPGRHGLPSVEAWGLVETRRYGIDVVDYWRTGAFGIVAAEELPTMDRLSAARFCFTISCEVPDQADLAYLQACWTAARWLIDSGCTTVVDVHGARWHDGAAVMAWPADRPFDFNREVKVIIEEGDGRDNLVHTRGMIKFARPDVLVPQQMTPSPFAARTVRAIGQRLAEGEVMPLNTVVRIDGIPRFRAFAYEPDVNAPQVNLNNDGLLLLPDD